MKDLLLNGNIIEEALNKCIYHFGKPSISAQKAKDAINFVEKNEVKTEQSVDYRTFIQEYEKIYDDELKGYVFREKGLSSCS